MQFITDFIEALMGGLSSFGTGTIEFMKMAVLNIVWEDPSATTKVLSTFMQFGLTLMAISVATGLVYGIVKFVRGKRG